MYRRNLLTCALPVLLASLPLSTAVADGKLVWRATDADIREPEQKAVLMYEDGVERLILSVRYEGAPADFGWIIPLPAEPEMERAHPGLFDALSMGTQRRQVGRSLLGRRVMEAAEAVIPGTRVLADTTLGVFDTTVLVADAGEALRQWLDAHAFVPPEDPRGVLDRYAREGWVWVAMRLSSGARSRESALDSLASGTTHPISFTFAAPEPVFPLEISGLGGTPSEILIYTLTASCVQPALEPGMWETAIWCPTKRHFWAPIEFVPVAPPPERDRGAEPWVEWLNQAGEGLSLGKHRRTFEAHEMRDVTFAPYDAAAKLASPDSTVRMEAITHLGYEHPDGADELLIETLARPRSDEDAYTAAWALGEVGTSSGDRALEEALRAGDPTLRFEATQALLRRGKKETAIPALVAETRRTATGPGAEWLQRHVRRRSYDSLLRTLGSDDLPQLEALLDRRESEQAWEELIRGGERRRSRMQDDVRLWTLPLLAAAGDGPARRSLVDALVKSSSGLRIDALRRTTRRGGTYNGFPHRHRIARVVDGGWFGRDWWTADLLQQLLHWAPALRNDLYRTAAAADGMPPAASVLLVAQTDSLTARDVERLLGTWRRAIVDSSQWVEVVDNAREEWIEGTERAAPRYRVNVPATAVAFALARHRRFVELEGILEEAASVGDAALYADVSSAAARTGDARFCEPVLAHVRDAWNAATADSLFRSAVAREVARDLSRDPPLTHARTRVPLEVRYRERMLSDLLRTCSDGVWALIRDDGLEPFLRLHLTSWIYPTSTQAIDELAREVRRIRGASPEDPVLARLAENRLDELDRRRQYYAD